MCALALMLVALVFSACVSAPVDEDKLCDVPVSLGMSRADLRSYFGEPRRIEGATDGGEKWYYTFSSPVEKHVESATTENETTRTPTSTTTKITKTGTYWTTGGKREEPVFLSTEGVVVDPIPAGRIVRR